MIVSKYFKIDGKCYVEASDYDKILLELEKSNEKVAKIESELFDAQKSTDEYYNKCIDLTNQIEKLKSELKTKDNIRKINLNEIIKVKLTPYGAEIYYKQFDELNKQRGREICKPHMPRIDKDGYTEFQLWHFMELYGAHIRNASQMLLSLWILCIVESANAIQTTQNDRE